MNQSVVSAEAADHPIRAQQSEETILPGYKVVREIGHGAQGKVYLCERVQDGQRVAIKRLNIESVKNWKEYELFHREATVLESLTIDGVARFYDAIDRLDDNPPCSYIIQEYIPGKSLSEMLNAGIRLPLHSVYHIVLQLLNILKQLQAHDPPVIHRDIKPSNILLEPTEGDQYKVWLIDFGAVANPQIQGGGSTVAGTFGYMPPEQLTGNPLPASDVYSLAAVIVYVLSGRSPADMPTNDYYLVFEPDLQNMPHAVVQTLRRMLDPKAEHRLHHIDELIDIWNKFSKDDYNTADLDTRQDDSEFDHKLQEVSNYCEPGNLKLWQSLSETAPRTIPESYQLFSNHNKKFYSSDGIFIHGNLKNPDMKDPVVRSPKHTPLTTIGLALLGIFAFSTMFLPGTKPGMHVYFAILIVPYIFFIIMLTLRPEGTVRIPLSNIIYSDFQYNDYPRYASLIKRGRKTIATIVSVDYIPADDQLIELGTKIYKGIRAGEISGLNVGIEIISVSNPGCSFVYHGVPKFRIQYRFNPPDDQKSEDLIHEVMFYGEPGESLKPGAPLPILYRILKRIDKEVVDSMPFPIPRDQVIDMKHVMYLDH